MSERPPFDPSRVRLPDSERLFPAGGQCTFVPREVNELVRGAIMRHLPATLHVVGQIGDFSRPSSGHLYFSLKDEYSELRCVMWRSAAAKVKFNPESGMEVIATGGLDVYTPRGTYQLVVRKLEPRGVGALEIAFRQLKERLEREGLFEPRRKKALPRLPRRVVVVTSPSGAAIRDVLHTLARRFPAVEVLIYPVRVQGEGAAAEIAEAVAQVNRCADQFDGIDVMIVGRGGGSLEDLWAFNEEIVARAIAASRIPVVSAVGHEVDVCISDLVADVRAATPTAAAELIVPDRADLLSGLERQSSRVARQVGDALRIQQHRLAALLAREWLARPLNRLRERGQWFDEREHRLRLALLQRFRAGRDRLQRRESVIQRFGGGAQFARAGAVLEQKTHRLSENLKRRLLTAERGWHVLGTRLERGFRRDRLARGDERLRQVSDRAALLLRERIARCRQALEARMEGIRSYDPRRVLLRGYSITREAETRRVITSLRQVKDKMRIVTELGDGEFHGNADDPNLRGPLE